MQIFIGQSIRQRQKPNTTIKLYPSPDHKSDEEIVAAYLHQSFAVFIKHPTKSAALLLSTTYALHLLGMFPYGENSIKPVTSTSTSTPQPSKISLLTLESVPLNQTRLIERKLLQCCINQPAPTTSQLTKKLWLRIADNTRKNKYSRTIITRIVSEHKLRRNKRRSRLNR